MEAESPRKRPTCCFCFTTGSTREKKRGSERKLNMDSSEVNCNNMEILTDMRTFSVKEQERRLKKALEEEEKISREAEKVVNWVKQESARMDASRIKTITTSDDDDDDQDHHYSR